jgi:hypothetical protein
MFVSVRRAPVVGPSSDSTVSLVAKYLQILHAHSDEFTAGRWCLGLAVGGPQAATTELRSLAGLARSVVVIV